MMDMKFVTLDWRQTNSEVWFIRLY